MVMSNRKIDALDLYFVAVVMFALGVIVGKVVL